LAQPFTVSGWAIDANAPTGTGVDAVHVNAYHNFGNGTPSYLLGSATYGDARTDVAAARGSRFLHSGYHFTVTGQPPGWYRFVVSSRSTSSTIWTGRTVDAYVDIPTVSLEINRSGTGTGAILGTGLNCPGGANTQAMPCGASYAFNTIVTLTAVPDPGSTFAGWGGGCANVGTNPTCAVGLPGDRFAFAYFTKTPGTIATTYYHTDAIGSVRALSDQTGATVIRHDYLPFGEDTQPLAGDPLRFAGKELDPESALMNFEARYYRNTWGRFTQVDPVLSAAALGDPQQWNRYAYAGNPLRFIDPTGLEMQCPTPTTCTGVTDSITVTARTGDQQPFDPMDPPQRPDGSSTIVTMYGDIQYFDSSSGVGLSEGWCGTGTNGVVYQTFACPQNESRGSAPVAPAMASVVTLAVTADVVAPPVAIPVEVVVATGLAVGAAIHDHWGDITGAIDRAARWFNSVFSARPTRPSNVPDLDFNNPSKSPGPDWERRGRNWFNPKTGESLSPDLDHGPPFGPHWDWKNGRGAGAEPSPHLRLKVRT
jgi:RHS repeat-associated protein